MDSLYALIANPMPTNDIKVTESPTVPRFTARSGASQR
jgi:hypothetical protein